MSRIGNKIIDIPSNVKVSVGSGVVNVEGKEKLSCPLPEVIDVKVEDGKVKLIDVTTARQLSLLEGHEGRIRTLRFIEPDLLVSTSADRTIRFWKIHNYSDLLELKQLTSELNDKYATGSVEYRKVNDGEKHDLLNLLSKAELLLNR